MKPREGIILLMDINCPFQKVPEQVLLPALGLLGFARGNFSCSLSRDTKFYSSGGNQGSLALYPDVPAWLEAVSCWFHMFCLPWQPVVKS